MIWEEPPIIGFDAEQMQQAYQAGRDDMKADIEKGIKATQAATALAGALWQAKEPT